MSALRFIGLAMWASTLPAIAQAGVYHCTDEIMVGFFPTESGSMEPTFYDGPDQYSYMIEISDDETQMSGIYGSNILYNCRYEFQPVATEILFCTSSLVPTMTFALSRETGRFVFTVTGPSGWLALDTPRAEQGLHGDQIVYGRCEASALSH